MKLIPYLVTVQEDRAYNEYNILPKELKRHCEISKHSFLKISYIEYLDEQYFKKGTNLGSGVWTIYTHYEINKKYYQLAFKAELNDDESIDNYILRFKSNSIDNKELNILRYIEDLGVFIDTPRYTIGNRRIETKNIFDTAGYVSLEIENIKTSKVEIIPIRVLPSSIDYKDYIEMIEDLISIREDIVTTDGGKVGIGKQWELKRDNYINCIDNIYNHIIQINNNPSSKLSLENTKVSYNKMKKIKPKTIIEKSMYPYKDKYTTTVGKEDLNMYENQIIKYSLIQIKDKIEKYKKKLKNNIDYNTKYLDEIKDNIENTWEETILNKKQNYEKKLEDIESRKSNILKNSYILDSLSQEDKQKYIDIRFNININSHLFDEDYRRILYISYNQDLYEFTLILKSNPWNYSIKAYDYDLGYGMYEYTNLNDNYQGRGNFKTRIVDLVFKSKNINEIKFLYDYLASEKINSLNLNIRALRKNKRFNNPLLEENFNIYSKYEEFTIDCEKVISINNQATPVYRKEDLMEFLELTINDLNSENEKEKLGFIYTLENKSNKIEKQKNDFYSNKILDSTVEKIDKLLNLEFIKNLKVKKDILKPTQIFINDLSYNKVFRELKKLNKKVRFLDNISPDMYFLKTTANIYENWCLYKIVDVLINDLGWQLKNKESVLKDIDKLLKHTGKFDKPCVKIELEHNIKHNDKMKLDLIYEGKIYYDENIYKTPDYQFIFRSRTIGEKRVYLDAKYRNYKEQGTPIFLRDINNVAIGKYYVPFIETPNSSDVSFIVHSDKDERFECFGGNHIIENYKIKEINKYNVLLKDEPKNNHRFGAFYLLPSYSFNINKFLRMILEYHIGMYNICWSCGEVEAIYEETKKTAGGNTKFHYKCNKCNEFWVKNHCCTRDKHKLIKHIDNYHSINENKKDPWYVTCPICFNGMDKEEYPEELITW